VGRETRCPASKEEILEEMVAKSSDIDFLKSDKTSLKELTNSELCETEEELD
jgi:5-methylthioribose kinase